MLSKNVVRQYFWTTCPAIRRHFVSSCHDRISDDILAKSNDMSLHFGQKLRHRLNQNVIKNVLFSRHCRRYVVANVVSSRRCWQHDVSMSSTLNVVSPRTAKIDVVHPCTEVRFAPVDNKRLPTAHLSSLHRDEDKHQRPPTTSRLSSTGSSQSPPWSTSRFSTWRTTSSRISWPALT